MVLIVLHVVLLVLLSNWPLVLLVVLSKLLLVLLVLRLTKIWLLSFFELLL
jgi:hypothetical protein